jgi:hypothetical protein
MYAIASDRGFGVNPRMPYNTKCRRFPRLVVGARNSLDLGPAQLRHEAKRGARRLLQRDREIALQPPPLVFFNTNTCLDRK